MDQSRPIIGHSAAWGFHDSRYRIRPYTLTPGATEVFSIRVREKLDIRGVGLDVVQMEGIFVTRRQDPQPTDGREKPTGELRWGEASIPVEFRSLELYGESALFGAVRVRLDPSQPSNGLVQPSGKCDVDVNPIVELPELGMTLRTREPIHLGSKVAQVPPVGDVARSENSAALLDEKNDVLGELVSADIEVGEMLFAMPLGAVARG